MAITQHLDEFIFARLQVVCCQGGGCSYLFSLGFLFLYACTQIAALLASKDHRPIVLCEYAHSMGNSTGESGPEFVIAEAIPGRK